MRNSRFPTRSYSQRKWLEAYNFRFRTKRDCTIYLAKTKVLIIYVVSVHLICISVFAYAKCRFSHDKAHIVFSVKKDHLKLVYMHVAHITQFKLIKLHHKKTVIFAYVLFVLF